MNMMMTGALVVLFLGTAAYAGDAAKGKDLYEARCSFCHGTSGKGDGPAGAALQPRPTNFTEPTFWKATSEETVRLVIVNGKPGTAMVPFGQTMKPGEIEDVVLYLSSFK